MSLKELKTLSQQYARKYGYKETELGRGFEGFVGHLFASEVGFRDEYERDEDVAGCLLRERDLGVDVVLDDTVNQVVLLAQCKWTGRASSVKHEDMSAFLGIHDRLMSKAVISKGSLEAQEALGDYAEKVKDGYSALLRFVVSVPLDGEAGERWDEELQAIQQAYDSRGLRVECELWRRNDVWTLYKNVQSVDHGIPDVEFALQRDTYREFEDPRHYLVARISGGELRNLYRQKGYAESLFQENIRLPMGNRGINSGITKTARENPEDFFFYNNGVSAVCASFEVDDYVVKAKRFQIVNGAQTVGALSGRDVEKTIADVDVLFRLTETGEKYGGLFTENVIRFNNTQNRIEIPDFRANDPIQNFLRTQLREYSGKGPIPSFYYQPKRGLKKPKGTQGKALTSKRLAALRHAFRYGPTVSFSDAKSLFDLNGRYWEAFGDGEACTTWSDDQLDESMVAFAIDDYFQSLKKPLQEENAAEAKYIVRLSRYLASLTAVGLRIEKDSTFHTWAELLTSKKRFGEIVKPVAGRARDFVRVEWTNRQAQGESQPAYNIGRSPEVWARAKRTLEEDLKSGRVE